VSQDTLVLASGSPRRKQLLEMLGIAVRVRPSGVEEVRLAGESPEEHAVRLAKEKAASVPGDLVLGADTIVVLGDEVLEKPRDEAEALEMLLKLQGKTHHVMTAVAVKADGELYSACDRTAVTFRQADEELLRAYVETGEPMDKAGAYGIQGFGAVLVERVEGDFFSVMGLPLRLVADLLARAGRPYRFTR
jgi:septum formation protein